MARPGGVHRFGPFRFDVDEKRVTAGSDVVDVGSHGLELLRYLIERPGIWFDEGRLRDLVPSGVEELDSALSDLGGWVDRDEKRIRFRGWTSDTFPGTGAALIGRDPVFESIKEGLAKAPVLVVRGPPGSGRSAVLRRVRDGALSWDGPTDHVSLDGARTRMEALVAFSRGLDIVLHEATEEAATARLARALTGSPGLLVTVDDLGPRRVLEDLLSLFIVEAPDVRWVVASREVLGLPGEVVLDLPQLTQGIALFIQSARALMGDYALRGTRAMQLGLLVRDLENPLAIHLAAGRSDQWEPEALREQLTRRQRMLATGLRSAPGSGPLVAMIDLTLEALPADQRQRLAELARHRGPVPDGALESGVGALVARGLLEGQADGEYRVPRPVAEVLLAQTSVPDLPWWTAVVERAEGWCARIRASWDPRAWMALGARILDLVEVWEQVHERDPVLATRAALAVSAWAVRFGPYALALRLFRPLLPRRDELPDGLRAAMLIEVGRLGLAIDPAHARTPLEEAVDVAQRLDDGWLQVDALETLGLVELAEGRPREGLLWADEAFVAAEQLGHDEAWTQACLLQARSLLALGKERDARRALKDGVQRSTRGVRSPSRAALLRTLGALQGHRRRFDQAISYLQDALREYGRCGLRADQSRTLLDLARLYTDHGRFTEARQALEDARAGIRHTADLGDQGVAEVLTGYLALAEGSLDEAEAVLEGGVQRCLEGGQTEARLLGMVAQAKLRWVRGDHANARRQAERSVDAAAAAEQQRARGTAAVVAAAVCADVDDLDGFERHLADAEAVFGRVSDPVMQQLIALARGHRSCARARAAPADEAGEFWEVAEERAGDAAVVGERYPWVAFGLARLQAQLP